jgi:pyrimidine-nucleoside phosphorylase
MADPVELLGRAQRGEPPLEGEVGDFVREWSDGPVSEAQMAAWLATAGIAWLPDAAAVELTDALVASGRRLDLTTFGASGDVQSTGAVGVPLALVALPLAAAMGLVVSSLGSRALGLVSGAVDRMHAVPGAVTGPALADHVRRLRSTGVALGGDLDGVIPAERRLATLREQTATLGRPAITAAAAMSRALAGGGAAVVLEIPGGPGGVIADVEGARRAAGVAVAAGARWGRLVRCLVVDAAVPLGGAVGNALEVVAAGEVLRGSGDPELRERALAAAAALAEIAGLQDAEAARSAAQAALDSGEALGSAEAWVEAQGGDPAVWTDPRRLPRTPSVVDVEAIDGGILTEIDPVSIGAAARWLGAGRLHPSQALDYAVGVELRVRPGDEVSAGDVLASVHMRDPDGADRSIAAVQEAFTVGPAGTAPPPRRPIEEIGTDA